MVIPAHPLALNRRRKLDERRQRALTRYYLAAGAGGLAVGVHTTQFAIHDPRVGLLRPVLELAAETVRRSGTGTVLIGGVIGDTRQVLREAGLARELGYHAVLLGFPNSTATERQLLSRARAVAEIMPLVGFYLQPAVGGRELGYAFWRKMLEIDGIVAIKVAPFDRYRTLDVIRAVHDSGRRDVALYTGNDDHILLDLLTTWRFESGSALRMVGGLLGHWAFWTRSAVRDLTECASVRSSQIPASLLTRAAAVTDVNAAVFDVANRFAGCIPGIHEVLRRQGLLQGTWCLDPHERLSPGQASEIDRVLCAYPELSDNGFVQRHLDDWLS